MLVVIGCLWWLGLWVWCFAMCFSFVCDAWCGVLSSGLVGWLLCFDLCG